MADCKLCVSLGEDCSVDPEDYNKPCDRFKPKEGNATADPFVAVSVTAKFKLGQIVMTRGVNNLVAESVEFTKFLIASFGRHAQGDWGDLCEEDKKVNEDALVHGERLMSSYSYSIKPVASLREDRMRDGKLWIITERDRSVTTALFPSEY